MNEPVALVVGGDPGARRLAESALASHGLTPRITDGVEAARDALRDGPVAVVLVHAAACRGSPAPLLREAKRLRPAAVAVVLGSTLAGTAGRELVEAGAFEVLDEPLETGRLETAIARAASQHDLLRELHRLRGDPDGGGDCEPLIGRSAAIEDVRTRLQQIAPGDDAVLLLGERGTGRALLGRFLHRLRARRLGDFVEVDCASLPGGGATGEPGGAPALFSALERARGGTLLLRRVERLGLSGLAPLFETRDRDARFVATAPFGSAEAAGAWRSRFGAQIVRVPPLRDRPGDAILLAEHFVESIRTANRLPEIRFDPESLKRLESYAWPENVSELRESVEHAVTLAVGGTIEPRHLPEPVRRAGDGGGGSAIDRFREAKRRVVDAFERRYLEGLLAGHGGNVTAAAAAAGMLRSALQRLLRKHELRSADYREASRPGERRDT